MRLVSDTLLFQHGYSCTEYYNLIALTASRTVRYCLKHSLDYRLILGEVEGDQRDGGHWAKVVMFQEALKQGYKNVIYLDADTIIADMNTDLREAIVEDKVGAVWHHLIVGPLNDFDVSHYNAGAFYASNTPLIREFMDRWITYYPGEKMSHFPLTREQGAFRTLGDEMGIINKLDNKWNAEDGVSPSDHPVVLGFHGFHEQTYPCMQKILLELEKQG
jgi:hypothetical protein